MNVLPVSSAAPPARCFLLRRRIPYGELDRKTLDTPGQSVRCRARSRDSSINWRRTARVIVFDVIYSSQKDGDFQMQEAIVAGEALCWR
jgi:hypothetical protein